MPTPVAIPDRRSVMRRLLSEEGGLATIEYIVGAAVVLGTLVVGVSAWNNGLVGRLETLVLQMQGVR
jgi:Flp pilus assembly pilin Flp